MSQISRTAAAVFLASSVSVLAQEPRPPTDRPAIDRPMQPATPPASAQLPPGHPPIAPKRSADLIRELDQTEGLAASDKPFQVAAALGKLYYASGRFKEAATFLRQAVEKGEPLRKLYRAERVRAGQRELPPVEKATCGIAGDASLEEQGKAIASRAKSNAASAASCARLALRPVLDAEQLLSASLFIGGDIPGARQSLERILEIAPDDPDALHAHASILFETAVDDVAQLKKARAEWERCIALRPDASNGAWTRSLIARADEAIAAGGFSKLEAKRRRSGPVAAAPLAPATPPSGLPPALSRETMEAFRNTEITPEMQANFARLISEAEDHLARGSYQQAMENYRQVMPYQPENGRLRAGMAWALIGLKRQPMADNIWRVAVGSDPAAVDKLGEVLKAKGDSSGATALWGRLASSDPAYAERSGLKARLKK
jgi:tetratricopeptide (TPR) repeat protein